MVAKPASCAPVKHSRAVSSEGARTVHSGVRMVRTVCAPLILCALTSPARSYATRCSLLPPRSGEACKARHATWGCVQSQAATAGALLELRPLANACLCEALGRQTRGSFDFCGPAEEQHSWTCDCTPRRPSTVPAKRQQPQLDVSTLGTTLGTTPLLPSGYSTGPYHPVHSRT